MNQTETFPIYWYFQFTSGKIVTVIHDEDQPGDGLCGKHHHAWDITGVSIWQQAGQNNMGPDILCSYESVCMAI